jgi:branched-chain amino acid aminotransferase
VLELAQELGIRADVRAVAAAELAGAEEIFITSTAGGVMPVTQLGGKPVGGGTPGPLTQRLCELYWARHRDGPLTTSVPYDT